MPRQRVLVTDAWLGALIAALVSIGGRYLFKLRQTVGVKNCWLANLRLAVVLCRAVKTDWALSRKTMDEPDEQIDLLMPDKGVQACEYAVLVTSSTYALDAFGQLCRDRADYENGFDELKNQWGWGGFTTQNIERFQSSACAVALAYNWWSWYCRAANPGARMEAITSRAILLASVGRAAKHARQTMLYLTPMHAAKDKLLALIANIRAALSHVRSCLRPIAGRCSWTM